MRLVLLVSFVTLVSAQAVFHNVDENENIFSPFLMEGDIRINFQTRGSIKRRLWLNATVPYEFSTYFAKYSSYVAVANEAMNVWSKVSCVKFVKRTNEPDYLYFVMAKGCWSYVGRRGGKQRVSLGTGCNWEGLAVHEIGHALGFEHEHSRPDRDDFVTVKTQNIKPRRLREFTKYSSHYIDSLGIPYDYSSIMHHGPYAYTKNLRATIVAKKSGVTFGQRVGPSKIDIVQIRKLYKCPGIPYTEYGTGCKWRVASGAPRCWRYCDSKSPNNGAWCWTDKSCAKRGFWGIVMFPCPASISFAKCATKCSL